MKSRLFSLLLLLFIHQNLIAQSNADWLFDDSTLPEIFITLDPGDLNLILSNVTSDTEYPATFVFMRDGVSDTLQNIGFRIRGNTSRFSEKKSFKVSFDTFVDGREYRGLDKMNINGEHNDPSIIRSKLSWDVFEAFDVIAPRSNHVKLFINGDYYGLYINVEHIDNEFVEDRFGSDAGNLYKALWPADLTYLGNHPDDYKRVENGRRIYDLKTNEDEDDYSDIAELILFLENASDEEFEQNIRDLINVDVVIRVMAVDIMTGMWDDYMFNKNNFYLYHNQSTDLFEFIPFDYDNTFGIDWFGIDWATRDINNWGSNQSRPLTDRLFDNPKYRDHLNFYIDQLIAIHFNSEIMVPEVDRLKSMIQTAAEADSFRTLDYGYTIADFNQSYDRALGDHVKSSIYGYISNRRITANIQTSGNNIVPIIKEASADLVYTNAGAVITINAKVIDDDSDLEITSFITTDNLIQIPMTDDGQNGDQLSGDGIYSAVFNLTDYEGTTQIYIEAKDPNQHMERFPFNPERTIEIKNTPFSLVINEFMASNNSTITDEFGAFEDWVELYNPTEAAINLDGYFLTDDLSEPTKWAFPDTLIASESHLLVWTDNDEEEGSMHTNFRLSRGGEDLGLFFNDNGTIQTVDAFSYTEQTTDVSFGRVTDGSTEFVLFSSPTPGSPNGMDTSIETPSSSIPESIQLFQNYPNPFNPNTIISFQLDRPERIELRLYASTGALIQTLAQGDYNSGLHQIKVNGENLASGIYFYQLETESGFTVTQKMTLMK